MNEDRNDLHKMITQALEEIKEAEGEGENTLSSSAAGLVYNTIDMVK